MIPYGEFLRNTLKDQRIKSYFDEVTFGVSSNNTDITLKAKNNRSEIEINNKNLSTHNLRIAGHDNEDVVVAIQGKLLVNGTKVLTIDDSGKVTGIDTEKLDLEGKGILVSLDEPTKASHGTIWGKQLSADIVSDDTAIANNTMYTIPVGTIVRTLSTNVPNGYLRANGQIVSREGYRGLFEFVKTKSHLITDEEWRKLYANSSSKILKYSYGNGSTTFRVPNMPTNDETFYIIKAYDELSARSIANFSEMAEQVKDLVKNKVVTGIGFIKFADGGLIQYGISFGNTCYFTMSFIDTQYSIIPNYEGSAIGVDIAINTKQINKCSFNVTNNAGMTLGNAKINFIAIGRWK